jgi:hypothetical protein
MQTTFLMESHTERDHLGNQGTDIRKTDFREVSYEGVKWLSSCPMVGFCEQYDEPFSSTSICSGQVRITNCKVGYAARQLTMGNGTGEIFRPLGNLLLFITITIKANYWTQF